MINLNLTSIWPILVFIVLTIGLFLLWLKRNDLMRSSGISMLSKYSRDLTEQAIKGNIDPVIGREEEIERVIQILCRRTKNNPVLIGKSGVGKTAIAEGLAQAIVNKKVPKLLQSKKVLALDLTGILAGTKYRGEFEKRLKEISDEISASKRSIILFIDEIHTLAEAGGAEGAINAEDILKPALARGELQVIGATTAEEYKEFIKKDVTLDRRLHPLLVDEPTAKETVAILNGIKRKYEQFHKVKITSAAIKTAVELTAKGVKDKSFPDKAIDLMDEAAAKTSLEATSETEEKNWPAVDAEKVKEVMNEWLENKV